jgi:hypothetical protein
VEVEIRPEPNDEERKAILAALVRTDRQPAAYSSGWSASALADLRDGSLAEEAGSDPGVVEP